MSPHNTPENTTHPQKRKLFFLSFLLFLFTILFFSWPHLDYFYRPLSAKLFGKRTVQGVLRKLHPKMERRFGKAKLKAWTDPRPLALLAFKHEQRFEIWKQSDAGWQRIRHYPFTAFSGMLGPKLREGDLQIPEGFYRLNFLHPNSSFYLSLKVNYPNPFDQLHGKKEGRKNLGGEIFIHGKAASIGCIALGDEAIEEVFYLIGRQGRFHKTRVLIAPYDLRQKTTPPPLAWKASHQRPWLPALYNRLREALRAFPSPT